MNKKNVVLDIRNMEVSFSVHAGNVYAVRNVSFKVHEGECLSIVGESGSGKSVTVQALMGLLPMPPAKLLGGEAYVLGTDILKLSTSEKRKVLGRDIAMIFQDPLTSLNPTMTIGNQIAETLVIHTDLSSAARRDRVLELLELVRIPEPGRRIDQYPHELSGGMRQRVMIAMALACNPKVLIADEPTTALDVTIQAQILSLIKELAQKFKMAIVLITHDLGVVAQMADRVAVMYAGKIVEEGTVDDIFYRSAHPYTLGLKGAMPKVEQSGRLESIPGTPPDLFSPPPGCAFSARCPSALAVCHTHQPPEFKILNGSVSCWLHHGMAKAHRKGAGVAEVNVEQGVEA